MSGSSRQVEDRDVLDLFFERVHPLEPLATSEVADSLDCPRRTAYERLAALAEDDHLRTKKIGTNVRIWWPNSNGAGDRPIPPGVSDLPDLTSEHVLKLEFRSAALGEAFLSISPDIDMVLDGIVELDDGTILQYLTISGAPPREVFETLEEYPHIIDLRLVSKQEDEFRIEGHSTPDSMGKLFRAHGGTTRTAYIEDGEFVLVGEVPPTAAVADLAETATSYYPDIALASVELDFTPRLFRSVVEDRLTEKQWTALTSAYFSGYFETPRESTGDDLAERLDISRQTFHHHLRKVEKVVFQTLLEGFADRREESPGAGEESSDK